VDIGRLPPSALAGRIPVPWLARRQRHRRRPTERTDQVVRSLPAEIWDR